MSTKEYYFDGVVKWIKLDDKFNRYTLDLYMDDASFKKFEASGAQKKVKEYEGERYVSFARPVKKLIRGEVKDMGPPLVIDTDGKPIDNVFTKSNIVGNGSNITCKVRIFDTMKGKGSELVSFRVNELVEYNGNVEVDDTEQSPF